ncbi:MAG: RHS repeat protein [Anaerolineae bacterium]|uniref:hypothetical protein n=1 Tax=Candidatus Amarolinea dominans TaxID=3140696 RepID=UPI003135E8DE|nr:RHS repeat protein [Anaerolineae bacterium]
MTYSYENHNNIGIGLCGENTSRYSVSQMLVEDGLGTATHNKVETLYTYAQPYSWASGYPACNDNFEFGGYGFVRKAVKDGAGALHQVVENSYHQCGTTSPPVACGSGNENMDPRKGKVYQQVTKSSAGTTLAQVGTLWNSVTTKGTNWVRSEIVTNTLGTSSQATTYEYLTTSQNNAQYGNVTAMRTYSDTVGTLYRSQETVYFPANTSGGVYIVNRPAQVLLKDATGACKGETRYFYDNNTAYTKKPSKGDVTKVRVGQTSCGGSWADTRYLYDDWGNSKIVTDTLGHMITTTYDTTAGAWPMLYALPTSVIAPLVGTTTYAWDKVLGQVTSVTDPNLATTSYSYDQWGRQTQVIKPGDDATNPTLRFGYTHYAGPGSPYWVKQEQKESGSNYLESRTFYDGMGRVVQTQAEAASSSQSILVNTQYQPLGVLRTSVPYTVTGSLGGYRTPDWNQAKTQTTYDALGRVTQVTQPDGTTVKSFYQDRKTAVLDALNRQTISETDAVGRLYKVKQYQATVNGQPDWDATVYARSVYTYTVSDQLEQMKGPDEALTAMTYDLLGRKTRMTDPDMGIWSYTYDAVGNLLTQTDARGCVITFSYDGLNRLTQKQPDKRASGCTDGGGLHRYQRRQQKGRRTGMSDSSGITSWVYDARGRLVQESKYVNGTGGGTFVTQWGYDSADRPLWMKYPGGSAGQIGEQVHYAYTTQGLLDTVQSNGGVYYVGKTQYNERGQVMERWLGSTTGVVKQLYAYSAAENFRLVTLKAGNASELRQPAEDKLHLRR